MSIKTDKIKTILSGIEGLIDRLPDETSFYSCGQRKAYALVKELIYQQFPELNESEDEMIRKHIIDIVKDNAKSKSIPCDAEIAYLEKQKDIESKYAGMVVVSQEEWDEAIAYAFKLGKEEGEKQKDNKFAPRVLPCSAAWFEDGEEKQKEQPMELLEPDKNAEKIIEDVIRVYGETQGSWVDGYDIDTLIVNLRRAFNQKEQQPALRITKGFFEPDGPQFDIVDQKPAECIEFDNEFKNQVSHLLASVLNREWEYNKEFVEYTAQQLLGYAKHEISPADWSEEDKSILNNIMAYKVLNIDDLEWLKSLPERFNLRPKQEWSEDTIRKAVKEVGLTKHQINWFNTNVFPPKQEWSVEDEKIANEILDHFNTGNAEWFNWFNARFKSLRPQPKQEWSKEDEKCIKDIIVCLEYLKKEDTERRWNGDNNAHPEQYAELITKLQSIFSRSHWKPSEEQMEVLLNTEGLVRANNYPENARILASLYEQLKKL